MNSGVGYGHQLLITRFNGSTDTVVYDGPADVQDAGASIPRGMTGQPGKEAEATAFLPDESRVGLIEQYDEATVTTPEGRVKLGEVSATRELDGVVLLRLDEYGLRHTVILQTKSEIKQPGGKVLVSWVDSAPEPGRLTAVGEGDGVAADQPSDAGDYVLTLRSTTVLQEGQRALVKGHQDDDRTKPVIWIRRVSIDKVLLPTRSKDRRQSALVSDVELNAE